MIQSSESTQFDSANLNRVCAFDVDLGTQHGEQRIRPDVQPVTLGEMTGAITHDFRNILAIVDSGLRLAEANLDDSTSARTFIAGARDGVERGLKLTSQLLAFVKLRDIEPRPLDVNTLLMNLEQFLTWGAGADLHIALRLSAESLQCFVDGAQFNAAILNIVLNARDAMPNGGEVSISTEICVPEPVVAGAHRKYARVRISDQGYGMSAEVLGQIFDPFFTTKGDSGTGLGLQQVAAFMRLMNGRIRVTSEVGSGTTFDLLFPLLGSVIESDSGQRATPPMVIRDELREFHGTSVAFEG